MNYGWKFFTRYEAWNDRLELFAVFGRPDGSRAVVKPLTIEVVGQGLAIDSPTLGGGYESMSDNPADVRGFLQAAMDAGWELGLRPIGFADVKNEIAAVRYHLEDMRKLAKLPGTADRQRNPGNTQ